MAEENFSLLFGSLADSGVKLVGKSHVCGSCGNSWGVICNIYVMNRVG
jgi:hypothetical protein